MTPEQAERALDPLREQIDQLDRQLVDLLNRRAEVVVEVGRIKRAVDGPDRIYAPERERRVLEQVRRQNRGPLPDSCLEGIWRELMSGSFALERPLRIGYLGPPGSFSHVAARAKFGSSVQYDALVGIDAVFEEIVRGHIDYGLVPIENTNIGGVTETLDAFLNSPVRVCAELLINIHHNLLANCEIARVRRIYSKPEALGQCRAWLAKQAESIEIVAAASTSKAAEHASQEEAAAAIGSTLAAEVYGLQVQFANIEDNPNNTTRFFIIGTQKSRPTGDDKTSIMFTTEHKAGALTSVLDVFRDFGINMTHIDKRPSKRVNWEYIFFVDLLGHTGDGSLAEAIEQARTHCLHLTVLGSYPRAAEVL